MYENKAAYNLQNSQSFYFPHLETVRKAAKLAVYEAMMMNPNSHLFIITSIYHMKQPQN